jgi:hypothetical protein
VNGPFFCPWHHSKAAHRLRFSKDNGDQGDQIGRFFTIWAIVYFAQVFDNYGRVSRIFEVIYEMVKPLYVGINLDKRMGCATIWAIF